MNNYTAMVREGEWYSNGQYHRPYRYRIDLYYGDIRVGVFCVDDLTTVAGISQDVAQRRHYPIGYFSLTLTS
jgi:hypothetical protein